MIRRRQYILERQQDPLLLPSMTLKKVRRFIALSTTLIEAPSLQRYMWEPTPKF